ncbi:MAG: tyrosine-protein phosphatase [Erysipelotrichaceae bacterium]|nr:tyrosine-protein phosphatase [Erysipelotrichaceae bacterium]
MKIKKINKILVIVLLLISLVGCNHELVVTDLTIEEDTKFGGTYIHKTIDEFCELGFRYGDSVNVIFSNGYSFYDIPFYTGYFVRNDLPLLIAYPGYPYIEVNYNNGIGTYEEGKLNENVTATIELNEVGKYLDIQNAMSVYTSLDRNKYESDEIFGNFRPLSGGNINSDIIYRSATPCDNTYNRAECVSGLCEKYKINTIIDLSDSEEEIKNHYDNKDVNIPYWRSVYDTGHVYGLDISSDYRKQEYANKVVNGLRQIINNDGPYLIHCVEGKDRTGFVSLLLEALCNASMEELEYDYMLTYSNLFFLTKENNEKMYDAYYDIKFTDFITYLTSKDSLELITNENIVEGAKAYLEYGGMSLEEIDLLIGKIAQ